MTIHQMGYYAHRTESSNKAEWQPLVDHLMSVRTEAGKFAEAFGAREWAELAGWFHDIGKYSAAFQRRLAGAPIAVDHATAGAQAIANAWKSPLANIPAYVIAGHHSGLPDYGSLAGDDSCLARRLLRSVEPYDAAYAEIDLLPFPTHSPIKPGIDLGFQFSFLIRMLFSCVVDADSLDAEKFDQPRRFELRRHEADFADMLRRFEAYMNMRYGSPRTRIDKYRSELLSECLEKSAGAQGLYTLTLPTGSGKTLISLGFALRHAVKHGLRRIIYVIPYTSIIEQNAAKFREVLGAADILEHHSNVQREKAEEETDDKTDFRTLRQKLELAEENWDYPVVVTTNVQFFESLFANKRSRCRKLHNIAKSIVILDEAQMMNGGFFKPSLYALEELARNYGTTVLLCTATQPNIQALFPKPVQVTELVADVPLRFEQFKRVKLEALGVLNKEALAAEINRHHQALCIVNTRRTARELFELCGGSNKEADALFHLSARMCPKHRQRMLGEIRARLEQGLPCRLISTQLIEAGVDIDFPVVYRELAGLDSIAQAAGRCNRNGRMPSGTAYVFETEDGLPPGWFRLTAGAARSVLEQYPDDPLSLDAVRCYFDKLYMYQTAGTNDQTDQAGILCLLNERPFAQLEFPFRAVADSFQLIDTAAQPVIIPYDEDAAERLEALRHAPQIGKIMRQLQSYVVQLYPQEFAAFRGAGEMEEVRAGVWMLSNPQQWYDEQLGVKVYSAEHHAAEIYIL